MDPVARDVENRGRGMAYVRFVAFAAAIGGFLFGFDLGMIGAANIYLARPVPSRRRPTWPGHGQRRFGLHVRAFPGRVALRCHRPQDGR